MQEHFLKGFVGAIPELQELNGVQVAKFIIAANVGPVGKPRKIWIKCSAWREVAALVKKHVFQGDLVAIDGKIEDIEAWIDKGSGKPKAALSVNVAAVFKGKRPGEFVDIRKIGITGDTCSND